MDSEIELKDLISVANEIRQETSDAKFNIIDLANSYGINVILNTHEKHSNRQGRITFGRPPTITVYRRAKKTLNWKLDVADDHFLTNAERFTIAHELGHWILWDRFNVRPSANRSSFKEDYWFQETLVNAFAGALLVPKWYLVRRFGKNWQKKVASLHYVADCARELRVSLEVVTTELSRTRPMIGFVRLTLICRRQDKRYALRIDEVCSGEGLILPNRYKHILNERFRRVILAKRTGSEILRGCSLDDRHIYNLWVSWIETIPSRQLVAHRGELPPETGEAGRWVAILREDILETDENLLV